MTSQASAFYDGHLLNAWKASAGHLANHASGDYVLVTSFGTDWNCNNQDVRRIDSVAKESGFEAPSSVASMLCPKPVMQAAGTASDAIDAGQRTYGRGRRLGLRFSGWRHTYFERISGAWYDRKGTKNIIKENRLLQAIEKLNSWSKNSEAALYLHTDMSSDTFRPRGSPCLQYVQIRSYGDKLISLAALYRSHDYSNKALGNFVVLYTLGCFIAAQTGRNFVGCDVISLNPFVGVKSKTNDFIQRI